MVRLEGIERYPPKKDGLISRISYIIEFPDDPIYEIYQKKHIRVVLDSYENGLELYNNYANPITGEAERFALDEKNRSGLITL